MIIFPISYKQLYNGLVVDVHEVRYSNHPEEPCSRELDSLITGCMLLPFDQGKTLSLLYWMAGESSLVRSVSSLQSYTDV